MVSPGGEGVVKARSQTPDEKARSQKPEARRKGEARSRKPEARRKVRGKTRPEALALIFLLPSGFWFLACLYSGFWLLASSRACLRRQRGLRARFPASPVNPGGFACRRLFREDLSSVAEPKSDFALIHALDAPDASLEDHAFGGGPRNDRRRVNPRNGRAAEEERDDRGNEDERSHQVAPIIADFASEARR